MDFPLLRIGMVFLSVFMSALFLYAVRKSDDRTGEQPLLKVTSILILWLGFTGVTAWLGVLSFETIPPTMLILLVMAFVLTVVTAFSSVGTQLAATVPLSLLVGFQSFRILVEIWLHRGYEAGLFPVQMTYSGLNFDIVSGATALVLGVLIWKRNVPAGVIQAWNILGTILLVAIIIVAVLSAPLPFRVFNNGPANTWVTGFPGVWLPAILVQAALLGHLLVFRRLARERKSATPQNMSVKHVP